MAVEAQAGKNVAPRRVLFGFNAFIQVILGAAVLGGVVYASQQFRTQWDLTRSGVNSLSPRSRNLLKSLDQEIRITALYTVLSEYQELAKRRRDTMRDLLALYDSAGGARVNAYLIDPMKQQNEVRTLIERLREKEAYRTESEPHRKVVDEAMPLLTRLQELAGEEFQALDGLQTSDPSLLEERNFLGVRSFFQQLSERTGNLITELKSDLDGEVPRYGQLAGRLKRDLDDVTENLTQIGDWMVRYARDGALSVTARRLFTEADQRYGPLLSSAETVAREAGALQPVKLEQIYNQLGGWSNGVPPVLVETDKEAFVVPFDEVWPLRPERERAAVGPDGDPRAFAGEAALSSAVLNLTQAEKSAVVFTRFGGPTLTEIDPMMAQMAQMQGRQPPPPPYQQLARSIRKQNFLVEEWNVETDKQPPTIDGATKTIYLVFPPVPPPAPNPRQPAPTPPMSPADARIVTDAIGESGMALFLVGCQQRPDARGGYIYSEYLRTDWGIDVRFEELVLEFVLNPEIDRFLPVGPFLQTAQTSFTNHPVGKVLQGEAGVYFAACPVLPADEAERPDDVSVTPVAEIPPNENIWTVDDLMALNVELQQSQGVRPTGDVRRPPFSIALAAEKDESRLIVVGSDAFAADEITQQTRARFSPSGLVVFDLYPANIEIVVNSLYWLNGDANRIAVGPRASAVPRLTELKNDRTLQFTQIFLVGIWPAVALLLGAGVWLVRRR